MVDFGGSATEETAEATTAIGDDSENAVTFRESGRIVVGKKGRGRLKVKMQYRVNMAPPHLINTAHNFHIFKSILSQL